MKKLISILLCSVLLSVYFTVFTVPAMAAQQTVYSLDELYNALEIIKNGDRILVIGNGQPWYVNKLIYINKSCNIQFQNVYLAVGDDGDYNYYDDSLIEVNQDNTTLEFIDCTIDTDQHDLLGDGELVCEQYGSIIYVDGNNCVIDGWNSTTFIGKTSAYYGGAIYVDGWNNCTIKNATFKDCESSYQGGAIYAYGENCTVENCKFSGCTAPSGGSNIYSYYEGETFVRGCRDANDNDLDNNTCVNCEFESTFVYTRKTDSSKVFYPAYPEEGKYIIRSAVDPNYVLDVQDIGNNKKKVANIHLWPEDGAQSKVFELKRDGEYGYILYTVHGGMVVEVAGGQMSDQIYEGSRAAGWRRQNWNFESDAPGGDDHYYIHAIQGGWMEAVFASGTTPTAGTDVQSNTYFGTTNQVWILEKVDAPSGFTISEGNTWIIVGVAAVAVVAIAVVISKKKKKAVLAEGEGSVTENTEKTEE